MRDSKFLLPVSLFFLLLSFALVIFWGYKFFYSTPPEKPPAVTGKKILQEPPASKSMQGRDSLMTVYNSNLNGMGQKLDSTLTDANVLKSEIDGKISEFQKLKKEIEQLIKDPANKSDKSDLTSENKRLNDIIEQLRSDKKEPELTVRHTSSNIVQSENIIPAPTFMVSDLRLAAMKNVEENPQETTQSQQAEKLVGSFMVKNNLVQFSSAEMMIIVLQPDGSVLQSDWESGSFETKQGKRTYSYKLKFEYSKGESKRLQFSLDGENFQKGDYVMQVYHNGSLVGRFSKRLS